MNLYSFPEEKIVVTIFKYGLKHRLVSSSNDKVGCVQQMFLLTDNKFINKLLKISC